MSCSKTLSGLRTSDCFASKGGIRKVYIANFDDVEDIALNSAETQVTAFTMASGKTFSTYELRKNVGSFTSTLNVDNAAGSNYVSTEIVLQFNKMEIQKWIEMKALSLAETRIVVEDCNGEYWLCGKDEPCAATSGSGQSGQNKTDGNFYQLAITAEDDTFPVNVAKSAIEAVID